MPHIPPSTDSLPQNDGSALEALANWAQKSPGWLREQLRRHDRTSEDIDDLIEAAILRVAESCERGQTRDAAAV